MAGRIRGMTRTEIKNSIDDIAEFTELGDFLKVPIRTYLNGMLLRLAFAIATARDPEILLIDEIIGVGDAGFFENALAQNLADRARILIVAAHADHILRRLCTKALWLSHGSLVDYGAIEDILAAYRKREKIAKLVATAPLDRAQLPRSA